MRAPWPEPSWIEVEPFPFLEARLPFTGPTRKRDFISIRYFRRPEGALTAIAYFGPMSEGAPGQVHGGAVLTVLDEALGAAAWHAGHPVLTVRLNTEFRKPVATGVEVLVDISVGQKRHRLLSVEGKLVGHSGEVYAQAHGRFMELDEPSQRRLLGR